MYIYLYLFTHLYATINKRVFLNAAFSPLAFVRMSPFFRSKYNAQSQKHHFQKRNVQKFHSHLDTNTDDLLRMHLHRNSRQGDDKENKIVLIKA